MTILANAPLIETIFELRWGQLKQSSDSDQIAFEFTAEDTEFFQGQFRSLAFEKGFSCLEMVNRGIPDRFPHVVTTRFRKEKNTWPCYQIGLGIFTSNQVNEGYDWKAFKNDTIEGLKLLDEGHPNGLGQLPGIGVELKYQDGFLLTVDESPLDFLRNNMAIDFVIPKEFMSADEIDGNIEGNKIAFQLKTNEPEGLLIISLEQAFINGKPGFVMSTIVRSADDKRPNFAINDLDVWLEKAHIIQKHAFDTLINQTYARTFK